MKKQLEFRVLQELRKTGDAGEFEGYIVTWDSVDSYTSSFQRGAFKKTIQERSGKVKVLYNHEDLIGSSVEIREDDHGCFVRGRVNLKTQRGAEAFELMKAGDLDALSFGFVTIKDAMVEGVRQIRELKLYEYGPVVFPASELAEITATRSDQIIAICEGNCEVRDDDFDVTVAESELSRKGYLLINALYETIDDIWWNDYGKRTADEIIELLDIALGKFHAAYLEWAREYTTPDSTAEVRHAPTSNELSIKFATFRADKTIEQLAMNTEFTVDDLKLLSRGKLLTNRSKLSSLPGEVKAAHNEARNSKIEELCAELRASFSDTEKQRFLALLGPVEEKRQTEPEPEQIDFAALESAFTAFNQQITGVIPNA